MENSNDIIKTEYPNNSENNKTTETKARKEIVPVTKGTVRKKSGFKKFTNAMVASDGGSIKDNIINDIVIPTAKETISNIVKTAVDMIFFGEVRSDRKSRRRSDRVSYRDYYDDRRERRYDRERYRRSAYDFDDVVIETRQKAINVLDNMEDMIDEYGGVSVAEYYEFVGVTANHTDYNYGWRDLRPAKVRPVRGGYIIDFPQVVSID